MRDNSDLANQVRELQEEIARLSAILALRKLEERHPLLERLVSGAEREKAALRADYDHYSAVARQKLGDVSLGKSLGVLGGVLAIGSIGYAILTFMGFTGRK